MTDNPLLTQPVQTSDGREVVVLEHVPGDCIWASVKSDNGRWAAGRFSESGHALWGEPFILIPKPAVHPNLTGTRTWGMVLQPEEEAHPDHMQAAYHPFAFLTLTDGDPASVKVEVVLPKGEG